MHNPYAPPTTDVAHSADLRPTGQAWRENDTLVIGRDAILGERCFVTGVTTVRHITFSLQHTPPWVYLLVLLCVIPYLIARGLTVKSAELTVPIAPRVYARHRKLVHLGMLLCLAAFVGLMGGINMDSVPLVGVALVAGVVGFVLSSRQPVRVKVVSFTDDFLTIRGVHPQALDAFADRPGY